MRKFLRLFLLGLVLLVVGLMSALTAMRVAIHGREVAVPDLVRLTPSEAQKLALDHGLLAQVDSRFYSLSVPEGKVMSQIPAAGTKVRRGWRVQLAESLGPQRAVIPEVGQSSRAAELNLRQRGLEIGMVAQLKMPGTAGEQVLAQSPPANAQSSSPKVDLLMSADAEPAAYVMPNLTGKSLSDATRAVEQAGLKVVSIRNAGVGSGQGTVLVMGQTPAAGQKVAAGDGVSFVVKR